MVFSWSRFPPAQLIGQRREAFGLEDVTKLMGPAVGALLGRELAPNSRGKKYKIPLRSTQERRGPLHGPAPEAETIRRQRAAQIRRDVVRHRLFAFAKQDIDRPPGTGRAFERWLVFHPALP